MRKRNIPDCPECGQKFNNVFEATAHILEDDVEFDPTYMLPNGYRLLLGSLLKTIYEAAEDPQRIADIAESTYITLFTAETQPRLVASMVQDIIISDNMMNLDEELKELLTKEKKND
jgi:hypothetical protein